MIRLAIFDCDGTLVDSGGTIHRALRTALEAHGHACPPRKESQKVIGLSLDDALAKLVPDADHAALGRTYKDAFRPVGGPGAGNERWLAGVTDRIGRLEARGWLLGVATGKSRRGLDHVLDIHGLSGRFVTLQTSDGNPSKPHPAMALAAMAEAGAEPHRTVMIGDTSWDMGCAKSAGAGAIGASWGYHDVEELIDGGAFAVANAPQEVDALAERWVHG